MLTSLVILLVAAAAVPVLMMRRVTGAAPPRVSRTLVTTAGAAALNVGLVNGNGSREFALTPDGSRIIYRGDNKLFVRSLDQFEPTLIANENASNPFVSPDGKWVAYFNGSQLRKVAITGGPSVTLAKIDGNGPLGATWGPNDTIVFATADRRTGLQQVPASGGPVTALTKPTLTGDASDDVWPEFLPGGKQLLFTVEATLRGGQDAIALLDLASGQRKILFKPAGMAHYLPTGHILYAAGNTLFVVPFAASSGELRGTPVPVVEGVMSKASGVVEADVAADGTLVYVAGPANSVGFRTLTWVDRQGREESLSAPPRQYIYPRISPDGTRIVVASSDEEQDLWQWDIVRKTLTRLTFDPRVDSYPVWTPDGRQIVFGSRREGTATNHSEC